MRRKDRFGIARWRGRVISRLDREATDEDVEALITFVRAHPGAEVYVEPETNAYDTTAVAIATDGEWTRRRVGSPAVVRRVAADLGVPCYDARLTGYPRRMREWNARHPERRLTDRPRGRGPDA